MVPYAYLLSRVLKLLRGCRSIMDSVGSICLSIMLGIPAIDVADDIGVPKSISCNTEIGSAKQCCGSICLCIGSICWIIEPRFCKGSYGSI